MSGSGFAWDRAAGGSIAPVVAVTLAHWGLVVFGSATRTMPAAPLFSQYDDRRIRRPRAPLGAGGPRSSANSTFSQPASDDGRFD
jgi:hypothetical protein